MKIRKKILLTTTSLLLMAQGAEAMQEEETKDTILHVQQKSLEVKSNVIDENYIQFLPKNILTYIFLFLDVNDLGRVAQVSPRWKEVSTNNSHLWKSIGFRKYGDFLTQDEFSENPRKAVTQHYLSVFVNTEKDLEKIEFLVQKYNLESGISLFEKEHIFTNERYNLNFLLEMLKKPAYLEELIAQGSAVAIETKVNGLLTGKDGYEKNLTALREFNEDLIEKGDQKALERKIKGLQQGDYGYEKNLTALREFNEDLIEKGDQKALERKIYGLKYGDYGYEKNPTAAIEFIEILVEKGDKGAIETKVNGLLEGKDGYEKNLTALREFNEDLIEKGDKGAIKRKIDGLAKGDYGYEKNPTAAIEFNDFLVEKGDKGAIERKIDGLAKGDYGYKKNPTAAIEFNDFLVEKGDEEAIERKVKRLSNYRSVLKPFGARGSSWNGMDYSNDSYDYYYEENNEAVIKFKESLVKQGNLRATLEKIDSLRYSTSPALIKHFIENLVISKFLIIRACGKYIKAFSLKYGLTQLGYERDYEKSIEFIKEHNVPF